MPTFFFDTVTLRATELRASGESRTFADMKLPSGTLRIYARHLTVESVPDRSLNLAADTLVVAPGAFANLTANSRSVRIAAQTISGPLSIVCAGANGIAGTNGANGVDIKVKEFFDTKTGQTKTTVLAMPTAGKNGTNGTNGSNGGTAQVWYVSATHTPFVDAPAGIGGARGKGGTGGAGHEDLGIPKAPDGVSGTRGTDGTKGTAERIQFPNPVQLWTRWGSEMPPSTVPRDWAAYRLEVAEYHFRTGTADRPDTGLAAARTHLDLLRKHPGATPVLTRIHHLLQRLAEHSTFCGLPRDMDIPPDVDFIGSQNTDLLNMALQMVRHAEETVGRTQLEERFAEFLDTSADQALNTLPVAEARTAQAKAGLTVAMSGTDLARARIKNIDQRMEEIRTVIQNEFEANDSPFGAMMQVFSVGLALGQIAVGVGTGVGALVEIGRGFPTLQKVSDGATGLFDLVKDVKKELDSGSLTKFKSSIKELAATAPKVYIDIGKLIDELDGIKSTNPDARIRELAQLQRERTLLVQEQIMHLQMEKQAQLCVAAGEAEKVAITTNAGLSRQLAERIRQEATVEADEVVETLITTMRQLMDAVSVRVFATQRAREIYLALDPVNPVRHDLGRLHPDLELILPPHLRLRRIREDMEKRAYPIVLWSTLVGEVIDSSINGFSRGPISFSFSTTDAAMVQTLRTTRKVGFYVPVEDLFEEDGSELFETKFDGVTIVLRGAKLPPNSSAETIKLRQLGRWSVRRRPDGNLKGTIKDFSLPAKEVFPLCRAVPGGVEANLTPPSNPRAEPPFSLWGRGVAGDWELSDNRLDLTGLTGIEVIFHTRALSRTLDHPTSEVARTLRALPGGLPTVTPRQFPIAVPPRIGSGGSYVYGGGYRSGVGSVTAVGAVLV